jgi:DNA-binding SARP family transcriptional activator
MGYLPYTLAEKQLRDIDPETRLIHVHPNFYQHHLLLDALLRDERTAYVRFEGSQLSVTSLQEQLNTVLADQTDNLSPNSLAYLILDEVDRAEPTVIDHFLPTLVSEMENARRVVVISRVVSPCVMTDSFLREHTLFVPVDEELMLWDYSRQDTSVALLEVRAFGSGNVLLNGQNIDHWDGILPRSLFFYLVDRGMVTRNDIFETFWPNLSLREATNVFHVTKRKISEGLGIDLTVYRSGFYRISPDIHLSYDAATFGKLVQNSLMTNPVGAYDLFQRARLLFRNEFLSTIQMDWVVQRRLALLESYSEVLIQLAKSSEETGTAEEALGLYLEAARINRQREDVASRIMNLYTQLHMPDDALAVYERLRQELDINLGVPPAPYLQELEASIREQISET